MKNVTTEIKDACTFCGSCVAVCPFSSLKPKNERIVLDGKCTSCGLCLAVCPGKEFDFNGMNKQIFTKYTHHNSELGNYLSIGAACASDSVVKKDSSSGGIVASLLNFLINNKIVDGAVCIRMNPETPWLPQPFIAKSAEEIASAQGSKYCLVPTNMVLRILNEKQNKLKRFAFVGLPCQVQGVRKMQQQGLCKNISLVIGLFCGWNMSYKGTKYLLDKLNVKPHDISLLKYRAGRWPGGLLVNTCRAGRISKSYVLEKSAYDFPNMMFIPKRCMACSDYMSEYADISVGDCWVNINNKLEKFKTKEISRKDRKYSSVIIRTITGEAIYNSTIERGLVDHIPISPKELIISHLHNIKFKRSAHIRGKYEYNRGAIDYNSNNYRFKSSPSKAVAFYIILKAIRTDQFKRLVPFWMLRRIAKLRRVIKGKE